MRGKAFVFVLALMTGAAATAVMAPAASAHAAGFTIGCNAVTFSYTKFPPRGINTVNLETVGIDGVTVVSKSFTFTGASATDTVAITVGTGKHYVKAHAEWTQDGGRKFTLFATLTNCGISTG